MSKMSLFMRYGLVLTLATVSAVYFLPVASSQSATNGDKGEVTVSVKAKGHGFPRTNFEDGREIQTADEQEANGSSGRAMASGDFDSDGTPDLMTVDTGGVIRFYKGNVNSIYPQDETATKDAAINAAPFFPASMTFNVPIIPDYLEAGDFNADGNLDLLAARNGDGSLYLLTGNGEGGLGSADSLNTGGIITALATGEIGRADGQADVAVAVNDGGKNWLLVFEHPASAFTRDPERIALPTAANDIAIGFLETDSFADIAVSGGNRVTLVRGRGHAYPFDLVDGAEVTRPAAVVETRQMPFQIAGLEIGYFTERRGQSLVMLSSAGEIQTLDMRSSVARPRMDLNRFAKLNVSEPERDGIERFSQFRSYSESLRRITDPNELLDHSELVPGDTKDINAYRAELEKKKQALIDAMTPEARAAKGVADKQKADEAKERAKAGFLDAISPAQAGKLSNWQLSSIVSDARLLAISASSNVKKLVKVRVSDSGRDELAMIDPATSQIHLLIRENIQRSHDPRANEIVSLEAASMPVAVLPMRLNMDAVTDLVVLREGSPEPTMLMTAPSATFTVTTLTDTDDGFCNASCSLREAIDAANGTAGTDTINFAVTGVINVASSLPRVNFPVTIDGPNGPQPLIEIRGNTAGDGANGLSIRAANVVVRRLAINGFQYQPDPDGGSVGGHGITIFNLILETFSSFNIVEGCYLGTDSSGGQDRGNEGSGLQIFDSDNNTIGGTAAAAKNVISGNGEGNIRDSPVNTAGVLIIDGRFTVLRGNYIGTTADGGAALGNSQGVFAVGSNNEYGGDPPGSTNVISGNRHLVTLTPDPNGCYGVGLGEESAINEDTFEWLTHNNNIKGNRVGTNSTGTAAIGNCRTGIYTSPRHSAIIGSISSSGRNLASGNDEGGIYCTLSPPLTVIAFLNIPGGTHFGDDPPPPEGLCTIRGNDVGVNVLRNSAIPNTYNHFFLRPGMNFLNGGGGLAIDNSNTFSSIGDPAGTSATSCTGFCNLASGETTTAPGAIAFDAGIQAHGLGSVQIFNNYAGVNGTGTAAIPNGTGIEAGTPVQTFIGAAGSPTSLGNLASGNRGPGISVPFGSLVFVRANLVGTDVSGSTAIPNGSGINVNTSSSSVIAIVGGAQPADGNVIAGNTGSGLFMGGTGSSAITRNNKIGINKNGQPLGNGGDGVVLTGTFDYIGDSGAGNIIANNGGNGVTVRRQFANTSTQHPRGNRIKFNSIYNNGGLGIDVSADNTNPITGDGVTPNDCGDTDTGPHELQNFPILTAPVFNGDGTVTVGGAFGSLASTEYTLDFYSNSTADPSGYGEGETYIGSTTVTTGANGISSFLFTSTGAVASNSFITGTASDIDGSTSEFSCIAGQCSISGATLDEQIQSARRVAGGGCAIGFEVNINTDEPDPNPADGICDIRANGGNGDQCSLRAAIQTTNAIAGTDFVSFDIPGGGIQTISPTSQIPPITETVFINATTQPGYSGTPLIELRGSGTPDSFGLLLSPGSSGSLIKGMAINRFDSNIGIATANNTVENCYIGLRADGTVGGTAGEQRAGINIQGTDATGNEIGGALPAAGNVISGNVFGITISAGSTGNKIRSNRIGTNPGATDVLPNGAGVFVTGADSNIIGALEDELSGGNTISGNGFGVLIQDSESNLVNKNLIGIAVGTDNTAIVLRNSSHGVWLRAGATENTIFDNAVGGHTLAPTSTGILIDADAGPNNRVQMNDIGVWGAANQDVGNNYGITVFGDSQSIEINTIGFNNEAGILISGTTDSPNPTVEGINVELNFVGVSRTYAAIPNDIFGIRLNGDVRTSTVVRNTIGNQTFAGLALTDGPTLNTIEENLVGVGLNDSLHPNGLGMWLRNASNNTVTRNIVRNNDVGIVLGTNFGLEPFAERLSKASESLKLGIPGQYTSGNDLTGNVISKSKVGLIVGEHTRNNNIGSPVAGELPNAITECTSNNGVGLLLGTLNPSPTTDEMAQGNVVQNSIIGASGTVARPNKVGMVITGAIGNTIGGATRATALMVVASTQDGIILSDRGNDNTFREVLVGVLADGTPLGNGGNGLTLENGASGNDIGGDPPPPIAGGALLIEPNGMVIANNGGAGISILPSAGNGNQINSVSVFGNTGIGIDIGGIGNTPNDPTDADVGPNNLQNYPDLISRQIINDELIISFKVDSAPANSGYGTNGIYVEFFEADVSGEGERFLGYSYYTVADYNNGNPQIKTVNLGNVDFTAADSITASATDANGNTSEFTPLAGPTAAEVSVGGRIVTSRGVGIPGVTVTITDAAGNSRSARSSTFGYYRFDAVAAGQTYVMSAVSKKYQFSNRVITVSDALDDIDFVPLEE